jgi:ABC-type sugar transport system permease subunit
MNRSRLGLSLSQRRGLAGVIFVFPWLIGFVFLFAVPLLQSIQFSFSKLIMIETGFKLQYAGLGNFKEALLVNADFNRTLVDAVVQMIVNVPIILFFSLFCAILVNQKYRGRTLARAIFFLPVVLASGAIAAAEAGNLITLMTNAASSGSSEDVANASTALADFQLGNFLDNAGMSPVLIDYLITAVDQIYTIISHSGVQILIFLAGLQSIPSSMYEVAKIDGATGYQMFWKITFPMVSPLILTNVIYSIIDSFTDNQMTTIISDTAFKTLNFGLSSAMVWMYTLAIAIILGIIGYLVSRKVFYNS